MSGELRGGRNAAGNLIQNGRRCWLGVLALRGLPMMSADLIDPAPHGVSPRCVREQADGALVLEPAVTISRTEAAVLADDALQDRVARAHRGVGLVRRAGGRRDMTAR